MFYYDIFYLYHFYLFETLKSSKASFLFKHRIIIITFTSFSKKYVIKKVIVLNNLISFESVD